MDSRIDLPTPQKCSPGMTKKVPRKSREPLASHVGTPHDQTPRVGRCPTISATAIFPSSNLASSPQISLIDAYAPSPVKLGLGLSGTASHRYRLTNSGEEDDLLQQVSDDDGTYITCHMMQVACNSVALLLPVP